MYIVSLAGFTFAIDVNSHVDITFLSACLSNLSIHHVKHVDKSDKREESANSAKQ